MGGRGEVKGAATYIESSGFQAEYHIRTGFQHNTNHIAYAYVHTHTWTYVHVEESDDLKHTYIHDRYMYMPMYRPYSFHTPPPVSSRKCVAHLDQCLDQLSVVSLC